MKAQDGTDSVESFEMEVAEEESEEEEEEEDEVFVKKGRHGSENGSDKKPLIKGSKRNGKRNGAMHTEIRTGGATVELSVSSIALRQTPRQEMLRPRLLCLIRDQVGRWLLLHRK